jgi:excisionase family DNA binding protein
MATGKPPRFFTVNQAAEETGLRPSTIRKKISLGELPHAKFGRAVRIPTESIETFIAQNMIPARAR